MSLEHRSKKELADMVRELTQALQELKSQFDNIKVQVSVNSENLQSAGMGLHKDKDGYYHIVKLSYDLDKNTAAITGTDKIETRDEAIVIYRLKQHSMEQLLRKARGGMYDK